MNILDKLKNLDTSKITATNISNGIAAALVYYDERDTLTGTETNVYEKLYDRALKHIEANETAEEQRIEDEKIAAAAAIEKEKADKETERKRIINEEKDRIAAEELEKNKVEMAKQERIKAEQDAAKERIEKEKKLNKPAKSEKQIETQNRKALEKADQAKADYERRKEQRANGVAPKVVNTDSIREAIKRNKELRQAANN